MRRAPLQRRTPLQRGTSRLKATQGLTRRSGALPRASERHLEYQAEIDALRPVIMARCKGLCERCGEFPAVLLHHKHRRSQGGVNSEANLCALDAWCHDWIHNNVGQSFAQGWLARSS